GQVDRVLSAGHGAADEVVDAVPTFPGMTEHFAERVSDGHPRRALLKLAGLLHDVAKPATKTVEETGRIRFLGHHVVGAEVAGEVTSRLRLSGRGSGMVTEMVRHHLRPSQMSQPGEMPTPRAVYRYFRDVGDTAIDTVYLNMADYLAAKGPDIDVQDWRRHCGIMKTIIELGLASPMNEKAPRLVDGRVLMERFGLQPGPRLGKLLELVDEARATGEIVSADDALELVRAELEAGNGVA
ncbi:MAG: HD domain-containing protein, partial [SAR202 cluster bacterium]|nr:HD domain-containing protein [SAR202 cluster bacterium]